MIKEKQVDAIENKLKAEKNDGKKNFNYILNLLINEVNFC